MEPNIDAHTTRGFCRTAADTKDNDQNGSGDVRATRGGSPVDYYVTPNRHIRTSRATCAKMGAHMYGEKECGIIYGTIFGYD